jgi:hypothetical protein
LVEPSLRRDDIHVDFICEDDVSALQGHD